MRMRLQRALARAGVASRRRSEALIRAGRVQVNGQVVTEMGAQVDPQHDVIQVDGREIRLAETRRYIKLYKPRGYLSVARDDRGRPSLADLVSDIRGLHPVGRLDLDSEGLLLLTDDGDLTLRLTHPRYEHPKEYLVLIRGVPGEQALDRLRRGVPLEDGMTAPARVWIARQSPWASAPAGQSWMRVVLREGRKRQIRRMCDAVGHPVQRLVRVKMGPIELGELRPGEWRLLSEEELRRLRESVGALDD